MENAIVTCIGRKGSGKSTWLKHQAQRCRRAIFADPEGKWPLLPGDVEVRSGEALLGYLGQIGATDPAVPFRVVYRDDYKRMQSYAPGAAFALKNCTLVIDEVKWFCKRQWMPPFLERIPQFGRERRVNLLCTTRRIQEVHDMLIDQADLVVVFRTEPGKGLDMLGEYYPAIANEAPNLNLHEYRMHGDPRILQLLGSEGLARLASAPYSSRHNQRASAGTPLRAARR